MPPIPETPRVFYGKNPLEEVICQFRFPPILRIDAEPPVRFQEQVRGEYPVLQESRIANAEVPIPPEMVRMMGLGGGAVFNFVTADEQWTLGLARDFLALRCRRYDCWENYKAHLATPMRALAEEYAPAFFTRVGLRYRDVIKRSALGLETARWSELLRAAVAGELASEFESEIDVAARQFEMQLERGRVRVQHGLGKESGGESVYVIDADFYVATKTEAGDALRLLDNFNRHAGHLFRWCITERLHDAMGPGPDADRR